MVSQYAGLGVTGPIATRRERVMAEDGVGSDWGLPQLPLGWGQGCYPLCRSRGDRCGWASRRSAASWRGTSRMSMGSEYARVTHTAWAGLYWESDRLGRRV